MVLVIDVGNSYIHCGLYANGRLKKFKKFSTPDFLCDRMAKAMLLNFNKDFTQVAIASVVPDALRSMVRVLKRYWQIQPFIVDARVETGLKYFYDMKSLGPDRIADAAGALLKYRRNVIVIDFGTATTFNIVEKKGIFRGGMICPGIESGLRGLIEGTKLLSRAKISMPKTLIGHNTSSALRAGVVFGTVGIVNEFVSRINRLLKRRFYVVATGGWGRLISRLTDAIDIYDPNLTLYGIYSIYRLNEKKIDPYKKPE